MIIVAEKRIKRDIKFILKDSSEELCKKKLCMYWLADMWPTRAMLFTLKAVLRLVTTIIPWNSTAGKGKRKIERHSLVLFWHRLMSNSASFAWLVVFGGNKGGFMIHMLPFKVLSINHKRMNFLRKKYIPTAYYHKELLGQLRSHVDSLKSCRRTRSLLKIRKFLAEKQWKMAEVRRKQTNHWTLAKKERKKVIKNSNLIQGWWNLVSFTWTKSRCPLCYRII